MKVKTKLAQLKANYGDISDREISELTGIDERQLKELENGEARAIEFDTLAQLCAFFQCTPNDLFVLDWEEVEIDTTPPSAEELSKASKIINKAFARAEAMPPRPAEEIWKSFEATVDRIASQRENSEPSVNGTNFDA
ncbi:helix-turn-helix transcriptional regulator [Phormidium pseudopriestleyi FRX01]|uniref:Helix-turn-helix transcriptional regulator n=1 Tax=Phormidium pseudopriestleyi FRX01 TaxID=1759528 RepID=A0ABS3FPI6_9CYAN|nr:helix-turn-helix transcriptional regulator [Phormidium pseudopriestleyi]MBO0348958.1 helix-turn-helix transcriptional regulator [Phormidium pseudopriestleyi FRX01]